MGLFKRNAPSVQNEIDKSVNPEEIKENESNMEQPKGLDLDQLEASLHGLADKIQREKEKNQHLIQVQKAKIEELETGLRIIEQNRTTAVVNQGYTRDAQTHRDLAVQIDAFSKQMLEQKTKIEALQLDVQMLEQEKDLETINTLLEKWAMFEAEMFQEYINPIHQETVDAKLQYFENLKQLRTYYASIEKLAKQLNEVLALDDKVTVHTWFGTVQRNPELLITKYDEQKEEAITHTYRAE